MTVPPSGRRMPARAHALWWVVGGLWALYLALDQVDGFTAPVHTVLKGLLMPALLLWAVTALGERTPRLLIAALVFATLGDVLLEVEDAFLLGMAGFFAMQVCYVVGFLRMPGWRVDGRIAAAYLAFWTVANLILGPRLGDLRLPIAVYSLALCVMAAVAAGVNARVGLGGLLFLVSDMLIGLDLADLDFVGRGLVVMLTYLAAQYLLVTGWARRIDHGVGIPA